MFSCGFNVITRQEGQSKRKFEDATLLALKMEKGSQAKEGRQPLETRKGKETNSSLKPP